MCTRTSQKENCVSKIKKKEKEMRFGEDFIGIYLINEEYDEITRRIKRAREKRLADWFNHR